MVERQSVDVRRISSDDLLRLGANQIAYLKPLGDDGVAVHGGDGRKVAEAASPLEAIALVRANQMVVAALH